MNWKRVFLPALLLQVALTASVMASGRRPEKASNGDWNVVRGTVTSVVESEGKLTLHNDTGKVDTYLITKDGTHVIKPNLSHEAQVADVTSGDYVTLYVAPKTNVIGRIIYPGSPNPTASVQTATSTVAASVAGATTTIANNVSYATNTVSNAAARASQGINGPMAVVGVLVSNSGSTLAVLRPDGGTSTFRVENAPSVDGSGALSAALPLDTRVKVWADDTGRVTRVSTLPADVNF